MPSAVDHIVSRSEFFTAYTPYQPELSQGTLQAVFEYQTIVCRLTGMDVSNASLYDGASATAEAVLMAERITRRQGVLLSRALHPEYCEVVRTYLGPSLDDGGGGEGIDTIAYCTETGATTVEAVGAALTGETACVVIQHPIFSALSKSSKRSRSWPTPTALFWSLWSRSRSRSGY